LSWKIRKNHALTKLWSGHIHRIFVHNLIIELGLSLNKEKNIMEQQLQKKEQLINELKQALELTAKKKKHVFINLFRKL